MEEDWKLSAVKLTESPEAQSLRLSLPNLDTLSKYESSSGSPTFSASGIEKLILTTQQLKLKQMKRIQLVKSQTVQNASLQEKRQQKDQVDLERQAAAESYWAKVRAEREAHEAEVEARRQEILAEAERRTLELREHREKKAGLSQEKLSQALAQRAAETEENRSRKAAEIRAKLEVLHRNSVALNEERQRKLAQKEAAAEAARKRVADMKAQAEAERTSQIAQAEAERLQAQKAAEEEYIEKKRFYESKVEAKEEFIEKKRQEAAAVRQALFEEARLKEEYARRRLELKAKRDQLQRDALERKVLEKDDRMAAIEEQRTALMMELEAVRTDVAKQDTWIKERVAKMHYEGKYELTPEIEALEKSCADQFESFRQSAALLTPGRGTPRISRRDSLASASGGRRTSFGSSPLHRSMPNFSASRLGSPGL